MHVGRGGIMQSSGDAGFREALGAFPLYQFVCYAHISPPWDEQRVWSPLAPFFFSPFFPQHIAFPVFTREEFTWREDSAEGCCIHFTCVPSWVVSLYLSVSRMLLAVEKLLPTSPACLLHAWSIKSGANQFRLIPVVIALCLLLAGAKQGASWTWTAANEAILYNSLGCSLFALFGSWKMWTIRRTQDALDVIIAFKFTVKLGSGNWETCVE